jgi:DNA-binding YbaB/EbfC family protein
MAKSPGIGGFGDLLKQAQELQSQLSKIQEEAQQKTIEASSGGGMVTATVNGKLQLLSLRIDPTVVASGDREMIEDLVIAAVNEALKRAQEMMAEEMSRLTGGLRLPGFNP